MPKYEFIIELLKEVPTIKQNFMFGTLGNYETAELNLDYSNINANLIEKYNNNPERVTKYVTETFRANQLKYYTLATHEIYVKYVKSIDIWKDKNNLRDIEGNQDSMFGLNHATKKQEQEFIFINYYHLGIIERELGMINSAGLVYNVETGDWELVNTVEGLFMTVNTKRKWAENEAIGLLEELDRHIVEAKSCASDRTLSEQDKQVMLTLHKEAVTMILNRLSRAKAYIHFLRQQELFLEGGIPVDSNEFDKGIEKAAMLSEISQKYYYENVVKEQVYRTQKIVNENIRLAKNK